MPLAAETLLFSFGGSVTFTALKWAGASVTVGSLVAAITIRVIAGGVGAVCAVPVAGSATAPSNKRPVVLNCMIGSWVQRMSTIYPLGEAGTVRGVDADLGSRATAGSAAASSTRIIRSHVGFRLPSRRKICDPSASQSNRSNEVCSSRQFIAERTENCLPVAFEYVQPPSVPILALVLDRRSLE